MSFSDSCNQSTSASEREIILWHSRPKAIHWTQKMINKIYTIIPIIGVSKSSIADNRMVEHHLCCKAVQPQYQYIASGRGRLAVMVLSSLRLRRSRKSFSKGSPRKQDTWRAYHLGNCSSLVIQVWLWNQQVYENEWLSHLNLTLLVASYMCPVTSITHWVAPSDLDAGPLNEQCIHCLLRADWAQWRLSR